MTSLDQVSTFTPWGKPSVGIASRATCFSSSFEESPRRSRGGYANGRPPRRSTSREERAAERADRPSRGPASERSAFRGSA